MNNERGQLLVEAIRAEEIAQFKMRYWFANGDDEIALIQSALPWANKCGTTACIGGMAAFLSGQKSGDAETIAQEWLELSYEEMGWLFYGKFSPKDMDRITKEEAIKALEWLMAGKNIWDWSYRTLAADQ